MNGKSTIVKHSLSEITALRGRGQDQTHADAPEAESLGAEFWKSAPRYAATPDDRYDYGRRF